MRNIGFFTGSLKKYFITHKKSVKLIFMAFYMISKNIFTNLFSRARSTLELRFALPGRGYSAKLRPYYLPTFRSVISWNYDFCGSYVTKAKLIKLR